MVLALQIEHNVPYQETYPRWMYNLDTPSGNRNTGYNRKTLLIYLRGSCSRHHLPPNSSVRLGIGSYQYGNGLSEKVKCTVIANPTNQKAALEALLRALEREFHREGFQNLDFVTCEQYLVQGLTGGYERWRSEGWEKPNGEERPNRLYWERIAMLCEQHEEAGCEVRVWQVNSEDLP